MNTNSEALPPPISGPAMQSAPAPAAPARSGACPYCLRKHLLKAAGYLEEVREEPDRDWEREQALTNLLLAEDHASALGDVDLKAQIRQARLALETGELPDLSPALARAREKILESQQVAGVRNETTEAH